MKIAVTGYYGFSNYGDNLFIIATKLGADEYWMEDELIFISPPIRGLEANYIVPGWFPKDVYYNMSLFGKLSRMYFFILAMFKSKAILNAGGSTISSSASFSKFKIQILMKKFFKKKIMGIGLSIGPFISKHDEDGAIQLIQKFNFLSVRDKRSCKFVSNLKSNKKISCSTDLVAIIAKKYNFDKVTKQANVIGVSLMQFDDKYKDGSGTPIDVEKSILQILEYAREHESIVRVFILNNHPINGDTEISENFIVMLKQSKIDYERISIDMGTLEVWGKISECSMMFTYRLHGAITAYLSNVPFYLFEYHQKCTDFLDDIAYKEPSSEKIENPNSSYKSYIEESRKNFTIMRGFNEKT